ncbi:hypothetical protein M422DRAFT_275178 [Sphaerobolus stellatus SS14]|uniref:Uncharacterized protein n=1 Tax=Sphaerobolus stellatus (strain SS14) TaxID=990650 RepID=A0A0C9TQ99_SPHS4|nr:hypothetical protein M422DRAFT_275178 [Sphaerobolus stellatus SS14]
MTTLQQCCQVVSADTDVCSGCHDRYPLLVHSLCSLRWEYPYGIISQDPIDEQKQQQNEEQFTNSLCYHFALFQHPRPHAWSPLAYLAELGFVHGNKLCISRGWDVNDIHVNERQMVSTSLSHAMGSPGWRRLAVVTVLLEHGATDVIDIFRPSGYVIQGSPALKEAVDLALVNQGMGHDLDLDKDVIRLLLDHGSLINSPYYAGGTHLARRTFQAFSKPEIEWVPQLLHEYGACLDVVFLRHDGLVDSFVGEFMECCVTKFPPDICQYVLAHGAKIGRPIYEDNIVITLLTDSNTREYFAWNVFCAMDPQYIYGHVGWSEDRCKEMWDQRISFLHHLGYDINALDCIVGVGGCKRDETYLHLEYCTALDWVSTIGKLQENEGSSTWYRYRLLVSSVLIQHGAKVLPRVPASNRTWRIQEVRHYYRALMA